METARFVAERAPFLEYLLELEASWTPLPMEELLARAGGPAGVAILGVDLVKGFCTSGPLASPQVGALVEPAARIFTRAWDLGVRHLFLPCDAHPPDSPEFQSWPPHCVVGTEEAEVVDRLRDLPFASSLRIVPKRSLSSFLGTDLEQGLRSLEDLRVVVALGDVTDLCLFQLAMHLRMLANVHHLPWEVVVPASAVATYDLPVDVARRLGAMPHDGDLLHRLALYQMQLNGIRVVADLR